MRQILSKSPTKYKLGKTLVVFGLKTSAIFYRNFLTLSHDNYSSFNYSNNVLLPIWHVNSRVLFNVYRKPNVTQINITLCTVANCAPLHGVYYN